MKSDTPDAAELIRRAEAMIPRLAERAAATERQRTVPPETIAEMKEAGLFRVLQPKRWGGYELDPGVFVEIVARLGQGCMSTSWAYGIQGAQPMLVALFDDRAGGDIWQADSSALMCSTIQPTPDVKVVDGGFRISGRWSYLSGCMHCDWLGVGGILPANAATPGERRLFLLPRRDWQIVDTWHVTGLKGTGSHDVTANDVFVPEYRTLSFDNAFNNRGPGTLVNTAPLYRVPFAQVFIHGATTTALGALRGMFALFLQHGATRVSANGNRTVEDPVAQLLCAEVAAALDEMELVLRRNFAVMIERVSADRELTLFERQQFKFQAALSVERCSLLATRIFKASGSSSIFETSPFVRFLHDIAAARQHTACQFENSGRNWGAPMLGAPAKTELMV